MNDVDSQSVSLRLQDVEQRMAKRDAAIRSVYGSLFVAAIALLVLFPFPLSRVGSVVMIVGFGYMVCRCMHAPRFARGSDEPNALPGKLAMVQEQIHFAQSMLYNVPLFVGSNLFWMGLPGTGTILQKAIQDFVFLGATSILFVGSYVLNQQLIRKELAPLRDELQRLVRSDK
jgi:hypothetical protein